MLRFVEGFYHYTDESQTEMLGVKWTSSSSTSGVVANNSNGRYGGGALRIQNGNSSRYLRKTMDDSQVTWIVGLAAIYDYNDWSTGNDQQFLSWLDSGSAQCELRTDSVGHIIASRNGTTLGTSSLALPVQQYVYIEWKLTIDNSTGVSAVYINGVEYLNLTSQDTQNTGNASANVLELRSYKNNGSGSTYFDDLYVCDTTGGVNDDFLGPIRVETLFPDGNGNSSDFTGQDADSTDNYLNVDESPPSDGDTTYNEADVLDDEDTYTYDDMATTTGTVYGVQLTPRLRKTNAGTRTAVTVARLSATETDSADKLVLDSYQYVPDVRETKPGGGSWTITDINSAEFGLKVSN